jgi:integration host factor subunit beta
MTRSDLVARLAERFSQLTQRDTEFAVKTILDAMSDALARGHRIEIRGFGSFSINRRPPRMGRNPRSGEQVVIPEKLVPHFKPGKAPARGGRRPRDGRRHGRRGAGPQGVRRIGVTADEPREGALRIGARCASWSGSSGPSSSSRCSRSR